MRWSLLPLLTALPSAVLADDQVPLKDKAAGWFDKAKSFIPSVPNPIDAGASEVAARKVERINIRNYQRKLAPKLEGEEEWLVYLTGGNKSCFGRCGPLDVTWNESVPLLAALPQPNLRLGFLDCEKEEVLCTSFSAMLPAIYRFLVPSKHSPNLKTPLHIIPLNISTTTVADITSIPSSAKARYMEYEEYTGALHPFDSTLAHLGLLKPMGYALWLLGNTPSWVMMIGISFVSRQIMSRRMTGRPGFGGVPQPGDGGVGGTASVPAPAPAAAPASPKGGSGGKKRK